MLFSIKKKQQQSRDRFERTMHSIRRLAGLIYILKADSHCIARNLEEDMKISAFLRLLNKKTKKY